MATVNVEKASRAQLRDMATNLGVSWDKTTEDDVLRKKLKKAAAKAQAVPADVEGDGFDVTKRGALEFIASDPSTRKKTSQPEEECFGWLYDPKHPQCSTSCPHAKFCKPLSETRPEFDTIEEEAYLEAQAAGVDPKDVAKAGPSKKKTKAATLTEPEKRKGALEPKSKLVIAYSLEWADTVEDDDLRKFYKRLLKRKGEGAEVTVKEVLAVFSDFYEVSDEAETIAEIIEMMVAQGEFKAA